MTAQAVLEELEQLGSATTKKTLMRHGAREPFFGVRVGDLKPIQKRLGKNHTLSLQLFDSGNSDAMYLAGLIAEPAKMTKTQLRKWAKGAYWYMISQFTVAWVASESPHAVELALEWMDSKSEMVATAGWSTYSSLVAITPDEELNLPEIEKLLKRVQAEIGSAPNRVRYCMNAFVIAVGSSVPPLNAKAKATARAIGKVEVDMGDTSCKIPDAEEYIARVEAMGRLGKKRKSASC